MTDPMKCALCGVGDLPNYNKNERMKDYFCYQCVDMWNVSPEGIALLTHQEFTPEMRIMAVQAFVQRVRAHTCKTECGTSSCPDLGNSHDCWGCLEYKDAPRPSPEVDRDCKLCIHFLSPESCNGKGEENVYVDSKQVLPCKEYVPRSCGNCLYYKPLARECLHHPTDCDKGVFQYWQPRPSESTGYKTNLKGFCSNCGHYDRSKKQCVQRTGRDCDPTTNSEFIPMVNYPCPKCHGDSRQYQKINKHNGEYCCVKCFKEWEDMDLAMFKTPVRNKLSLGEWVDSFDVSKEIPSFLLESPACARCCNKAELTNTINLAVDGDESIKGQLCNDCSEKWRHIRQQYEIFGIWKDAETAAGRPWACDKVKVKICDVCEGRGIIPSYYPGEPPEDCPKCYPKEPAAAPVIKQNEVKNVTDIIRYCEKCGEEIPSVLEMKQKLDNAYRERDLLIEAKNETELIRQRLERAKGDLAAQRDEYVEQIHIRDAELSKVTTELKQVSTDRYAEACRADALQQKLARRGIPFTVRRMMKQLYAHGNFNGVDCCGIFDQVGTHGRVKCNECGAEFTPKEIKRLSKVVPPAKPAPLKQLQKEIRRRKEREYKERHKIFDRIEETRNIIGGVIEFGGFRNEHSSGLYYYGAKVLDLCGSIENEQLWKEHKAKILPALEQYLQEKLKEAPQ